MHRVKSSNLHSHSYDPLEQKYAVKFNCPSCKGDGCATCKHQWHTGQVYEYEGVPVEKYTKIRDASSPGAAFHAEIVKHKDPKTGKGFEFTKRPA